MPQRFPFRYVKTSPEIIRLAVIMCIRSPQSFRNLEDLMHARRIGIHHETVRSCWHRFGSLFAAEIHKRRVEGRRFNQWRWRLDEACVKTCVKRHYLWRAAVRAPLSARNAMDLQVSR